MALVLLVGGLVIASLPIALRRVGRRVDAADWADMCFTALVGGTVLVEAGAVLWAAPSVLRSVGVSALADACERIVGTLLPLGRSGGALALVIALLVPVLALRGVRRAQAQTRSLAIEPGLGQREQRADYELVVLPTAVPLAYSVATPAPQVVISEGLCRALSREQLAAVIAHEHAHITCRHPRLLLIVAAAAAALRWWPPANRSHQILRAAVERWADDEASGRDRARRRSLRDALVTVALADHPPGVAAFTLADATVERIEALEATPRASTLARLGLYAPGAAAAFVVVGAFLTWFGQAEHVMAMAGRCPT